MTQDALPRREDLVWLNAILIKEHNGREGTADDSIPLVHVKENDGCEEDNDACQEQNHLTLFLPPCFSAAPCHGLLRETAAPDYQYGIGLEVTRLMGEDRGQRRLPVLFAMPESFSKDPGNG